MVGELFIEELAGIVRGSTGCKKGKRCVICKNATERIVAQLIDKFITMPRGQMRLMRAGLQEKLICEK